MTTSKAPHMTDYEVERRAFHLDVPEYFNFATDHAHLGHLMHSMAHQQTADALMAALWYDIDPRQPRRQIKMGAHITLHQCHRAKRFVPR